MEVLLKSKKEILKSFQDSLPLILISLVFYWLFFVFLVMATLKSLFGIDEVLARKAGWVIGPILLVFSAYLYLKWEIKSLSSYRLSIINGILEVRGRSGWKSINIAAPIGTIKEINIGQNVNMTEELFSWHPEIQNKIAYRINIILASGASFKLDSATKVFNHKSLLDFLAYAKGKGIGTNVSV